VIEWLRRQKIGDNPDFDHAQLNELMKSKKGTPTMGGILIIFSIAATTLLLAGPLELLREDGVDLPRLARRARIGGRLAQAHRRAAAEPAAKGSRSRKLLFQVGLSVVLAYFTYNYGKRVDAARSLRAVRQDVSHRRSPSPSTSPSPAIVMTGTSNAVNLTDGLDGLASGCMALVGFTFLVLAILVGTPQLAGFLQLPAIEAGGQMAVSPARSSGRLGFLWYNCNPAKVFMGDTGSLALGGLIAYIAIVIRHELTLVIAGGIFVFEALSVLLQVSYFSTRASDSAKAAGSS
jgi:phospho-N-acetylmuramoyl-pentapeptide-transferase